MVLQRVKNIRSGWKSIFLVFSLAARDNSPQIVRLAFDTMSKIVRDYFQHITATDITTFTDCVNCLVAFTQNPHQGEALLDISLNAIAFLRFCAEQLAEGAIGNVENVKLEKSMRRQMVDEVVTRIKSQGSIGLVDIKYIYNVTNINSTVRFLYLWFFCKPSLLYINDIGVLSSYLLLFMLL